MANSNAATLLDVPWEDVVYSEIFSHLSLADLFSLHETSPQYAELVDLYLSRFTEIDISACGSFENLGLMVTFISYIRNNIFKFFLFQILAGSCRNIHKVNLTKCDWIEKKPLTEFLTNNPDIVDFNLSKIGFNINKYLHLILGTCRRIERINLSGCRHLTSGALETLIYTQGYILSLNLSRCVLISEKTLKKLLIKFYNIRNLSLVGIPSVNQEVLKTIKVHCDKLEFLNVDECPLPFMTVR